MPETICNYCGQIIFNAISINNHSYCYDCTFTCSHCGEPHLRISGYVYIHNGDIVCRDCIQEHYGQCHECQEYYPDNDLLYDDHTDEYYCSDCYDDLPRGSTRMIRDYHNNPRYCFKRTANEQANSSTKYFGFELEIEDGDLRSFSSDAFDLSDDESHFWMSHDGSLNDSGVELITHPMTIAYFNASFPLDDLLSLAKSYGMKGHNSRNGGLHIHFSKNWFGDSDPEIDETLCKCILLTDRYRSIFHKISRRRHESFNSYAEPYEMSKPKDTQEIHHKGHNHYKIISIASNTIELRMFKSTLRKESLLAAIEFYQQLVTICRTLPYEAIDAMSFNDVRSFLEQGTSYLSNYLFQRLGSFTPSTLSISTLLEDIEKRRIEADNAKFDYYNQTYAELVGSTEDPISFTPSMQLSDYLHEYSAIFT